MILTAHQPAYLPWLGLFHKIALADKFIFFDQVQYVPRDWINRNQVKGKDGPIMLTVPVLTKGYLNKSISEIEINNSEPWRRKHWKTIQLNYHDSKYFKTYSDFFEDVYQRDWKLLADLNFYMLIWFLQILGFRIEVERAGRYHFQGFKSDLVLDMCLQLKADFYIFGALGKDYADIDKFKRSGVEPYFQSYDHPTYHQLHGQFIPYMSIMDLIFNEGPNSLDILMLGNINKQGLINKFGGIKDGKSTFRYEK